MKRTAQNFVWCKANATLKRAKCSYFNTTHYLLKLLSGRALLRSRSPFNLTAENVDKTKCHDGKREL